MPEAQCEVCGNQYDKAFEVRMDGKSHTFDSFECAIHALAPRCAHCACRILGHGMEDAGAMYCCASCANQAAGSKEFVDRVQ
jgi:phage terminase large subunit GpA-like protein